MSEVQIIDNVLPEDDYNKIAKIVNGDQFPWKFCPTTTGDEVGRDFDFQFVHPLFVCCKCVSPYWDEFDPVIEHLKIGGIIRAKLNLQTQTHVHMEGGYHTDTRMEHLTSVMYFDDSNGYTKFEETGQEVQSKANRLLTFPSHMRHTGVSQTDQQKRVVLNLNWIKWID